MKRKLLAAAVFACAMALTVTAACSDNNTDDYLSEIATTETTELTTETTTEAATEATTAAKKEYPELVNTYSGTYVATQGLTALDLSVFGTDDDGDIQALFSFHEDPSNKGVPTGSYLMEGTAKDGDDKDIIEVEFRGSEWEEHPDTYHIIEFTARFDVKNGTVTSDEYKVDLKKSAGADLSILLNSYDGTYQPDKGDNRIKFTIEDAGDHGDLQAVFEFEPEEGKKASFISKGQITNIAPDGRITASFTGQEWMEKTDDQKFIDFSGIFTADGRNFNETDGHHINLYLS
ncbi:hypothetical protein [uncultured Ruminococcus sp.]|uniref:hypothetical protein n=1 Tax=uncultured Ruminococcus sp. TaxID=165186 RepID=UPI00260C6F50|nr:hypothetical protein [uncultured Ruminococcus sp.]